MDVEAIAKLRKELEQYSNLKRVAIQTNDWLNIDRLTEQVKDIFSQLSGAEEVSVYALVRSDTSRNCPDENQALYYKSDLLILFDPTCSCTSEKVPTIRCYCSSVKINVTKQVTESINAWWHEHDESDSQELSPAALVLLDLGMSVDDCTELMARSVLPVIIAQVELGGNLKILYHISEAVMSEQWESHWKDTDCDKRFEWHLIIPRLSDKLTPTCKLYIERHYGCFKNASTYVRGLAIQRYTFTTIPYTRVTLIVNERLSPTQDTLRRNLKKILREHKKIVIQVSCNPITQTKLENFSDTEVFVYIGCEAQMIYLAEQSKEQRRKILTPYEILVGLGLLEWTTHFVVKPAEISSLLEESQRTSVDQHKVSTEDIASLPDGALVVAGGHALKRVTDRTFQGVQGDEKSHDFRVHEGLTGIASRYDKETNK